MGNSSQCTFLPNTDQHYQFIGEENHFLYDNIRHFKNQKIDNQHFVIKNIKFDTENSLNKFREFISLYQEICEPLHLTRISEFRRKKQKPTKKQNQESSDSKDSDPFFQCNKDNLIFTSATEQLSCSEPLYHMTLSLQYLEERCSLQSLLVEKAEHLSKALENNKVNQNILLDLQSKVKLYEYQKIDLLPPKERTVVNLFFNQIEVLRILDHMLTALYGLKINDIEVNAVRPELFFKSLVSEDISFFCPRAMNINNMSNFKKSYESLKKWLNQENALFHHNWNAKQRQLISYVHPDQLEKLSEHLKNDAGGNFVDFNDTFSREELEKQNIFALGLIILEICLVEPHLCSKVYHVSTCKSQQKAGGMAKKEIRYSFERQNLTIKLNTSVLQKYLIQMKTRYSQQFVSLVQLMLMGSSTKPSPPNYQTLITLLAQLTQSNISSLKSVYNNPLSKTSKSKSKQPTQKQSRKSSLSKQVSYSAVSNQTLSSSSSLSMFPVQTQQKIASVQLLKRNVKKIQTKADTVMNKSEFETLNGSFAKKQDKIQEIVKKDEERILAQLDKLNKDKNIPQKQLRFSYRKQGQNQVSKNFTGNIQRGSFGNTTDLSNKTNEIYDGYKISFPPSLSLKSQSQSLDKEKRVNSTTKTKKIILQRAKEEQNMGNSVCHTIYLNNSRNSGQQNGSITNKDTVLRKIDPNTSKVSSFNEIQPFYQGPDYGIGSKSQLKNLIAARNKNSHTTKQPSTQYLILNNSQTRQDKSPKEMKSKQLYQIYLKEYKNLVQNQQLINQ